VAGNYKAHVARIWHRCRCEYESRFGSISKLTDPFYSFQSSFIPKLSIVPNDPREHSQINIVCNRQVKPERAGLQRYKHNLGVYSIHTATPTGAELYPAAALDLPLALPLPFLFHVGGPSAPTSLQSQPGAQSHRHHHCQSTWHRQSLALAAPRRLDRALRPICCPSDVGAIGVG